MRFAILKSIVVFLALALAASVLAQAPIPREISFQGKLTDTGGNPITSAVDLRFTLWNASTGGSSLWTEMQAGITPDGNGLYNVMLGAVTPFPLNFNSPYWLEVEVAPASTSNWEALTPRYQLGASPYAINAETVNGFPAATAATPNTLLPLDGSGLFPVSVIPQGTGSTLDSDTVDSIHASATATANTLLALDGAGLFPASVITQGTGSTLDSDLVDGIHASATATVNTLLALDGAGLFPASVITQGTGSTLDSDLVDSIHASATASPNNLLALDGSGLFPVSVITQGSGSTLDADLLDGQDSAAFAPSGHTHATYVDLASAQTITGLKTFNPSAGTVPFALDASK
ncbi:MAG: hypothetical protein ACYS47_18455, partial [Planctomycetota bacterium]